MTDLLPIPLTPEVRAEIQSLLSYKDWSDEPEVNIRRMRQLLGDIDSAIIFAEGRLGKGHYYEWRTPLNDVRLCDKGR